MENIFCCRRKTHYFEDESCPNSVLCTAENNAEGRIGEKQLCQGFALLVLPKNLSVLADR